MAPKRKEPRPGGSPSRPQAVDQPSADGVLDGILREHNIAAVTDQAGHALLLRPNSVVVDAPKGETRTRLSAMLPKLVPGARAEFADDELAIVTLPVVRRAERRAVPGTGAGPKPDCTGEIGDATDLLHTLREAKFAAEYNHVVIGAQTVIGSPLGATASWAGDMAFVGTITDETTDGKPVILSTAMPSAPPPVPLRAPLAIPGKVPPRVLVLDTGLRTELVPGATKRARPLRRAEHVALTDCRTRPGAKWLMSPQEGLVDDEDETNDDGRPILDFEAGHGTFIAGIVRQICPDAVVHSAGVLSSFGDGDVYGVIRAIDRVLADIGEVDIVVMSFGTNLVGDKPGLFGSELNRVLGNALGVAAAGNQSTCRPYFPAALPDVIGVGGLAADGKAWFTNFGGWVDACAPAIDVVSTFFNHFDETLHVRNSSGNITPTVTRRYRGWARWSGTSFAAPKVAALIAQEMYLNGRPGQTARDAWDRLTSYRHYRYPDLGIVFNV